MTRTEARAFLASCDPGLLRVRAGITLRTVGEAFGRSQPTVWARENRGLVPRGDTAQRYCRFIAGLIRHESVPYDPEGDAVPGAAG